MVLLFVGGYLAVLGGNLLVTISFGTFRQLDIVISVVVVLTYDGIGQIVPVLAHQPVHLGFCKEVLLLKLHAHAFGAFAGAAMFEVVRFYAAAQLANAWQLILGVVLIVIILYAPNGLIGLRQRDKRSKEAGH